jgi:hypothetical protein
MNDRGDNILSLARELLRNNELASESAPKQNAVSFKVLCFTAMLAAACSSVATNYITDARRPLNRYEKVELDALIFYAARIKNTDEASIRRKVENRIGVQDFEDLTKCDYQIAQSFLRGEIQ